MPKMIKVITVQVLRPEMEELTPQKRIQIINDISKDVAEQIVKQEEFRFRNENVLYWQQKLMNWAVEDAVNEIKYGKRDTDKQEP